MQTRIVNVSGGGRIKRQLSFMSGGALRLLFSASLVDANNKRVTPLVALLHSTSMNFVYAFCFYASRETKVTARSAWFDAGGKTEASVARAGLIKLQIQTKEVTY